MTKKTARLWVYQNCRFIKEALLTKEDVVGALNAVLAALERALDPKLQEYLEKTFADFVIKRLDPAASTVKLFDVESKLNAVIQQTKPDMPGDIKRHIMNVIKEKLMEKGLQLGQDWEKAYLQPGAQSYEATHGRMVEKPRTELLPGGGQRQLPTKPKYEYDKPTVPMGTPKRQPARPTIKIPGMPTQ